MLNGRFRVELVGTVPVVTAPEAIDVTNADELQRVLLHAAAEGHRTYVVDLTETRFCDCAALGVLVAAHERADAEGRELLVVISSAAVLRLFEVTGADRVIPSFAHMGQALARMPGARA